MIEGKAGVPVLGIDIGLAAMGWAVAEVTHYQAGKAPTVRIVGAGVWTTAKETKKRQLHVGSDDARRVDYLVDRIVEKLTAIHHPSVCGYELPGGAKGARAAHALGMAHGIVRATLRANGGAVPVEITARDVKLALAGGPTASKDEMIAAAAKLWPPLMDLGKTVREHAADAIGVVVATVGTQVGRAALGRSAA